MNVLRNNMIIYKKVNHLTNKDIAKALGCSERTIARHLEEPRKLTIQDLERWAEALGTEVETLLRH